MPFTQQFRQLAGVMSDALLNEKIPGDMATDVAIFPGILNKMPPQGSEQVVKTPGKTNKKLIGGNAGGNIPRELAELVELWPNLVVEVRQACLELARGGIVNNR